MPSQVIDANDEMGVIAKQVGDFPTSEAIPDLTSKVLLKVSKTSKIHFQPNAETVKDLFQFAIMNYWMLVFRDMITFTGSECNKIGVGYTAFQTQGQRCDVPVNS